MSVSAVRLNKAFDKKLLVEALHALSHIETKPANYPGDGNTLWNALPIYTLGGSRDNLEKYLPYIAELDLQFRLVRFLDLEPGGVINEHVDTFLTGRVVRLHLPVITHEDVEFYLDHKRCSWQEGELWYGDFSMPHSVTNKSDIKRVHLVLDVAADENLLKLFSPGTIPPQLYDSLKTDEKFDLNILKRFTCNFWVPEGFRLPGTDFPPLESAVIANFRLIDGEFCLFINDQPMVRAIPVTENKLSLMGVAIEMSVDYTFKNDVADSLTFNIGDRVIPGRLA
ncbi:MAG: hypothetical protein ACI837_002652 [Crocinitomicaceae bacterium]|jgi:hypothetical protein